MKKYFAKQISIFKGAAPNLHDYTYDTDFPHQYLKDLEIHKQEREEHMQFLVLSRDKAGLSIGDHVAFETASGSWGRLKIGGEPEKFIKDPDYYLIVGELSPEADWVIDQQEFDDEEITIYDNQIHDLSMVHIKCPTCKHYN
ncbi:MAG TPA: hypothetical protein VGM30_10310 [Puia sp.]|jgi:hypothetical protein